MYFRKEYRVLIIVAIFFILLSIFRSTETFNGDDSYGSEGPPIVSPPPPTPTTSNTTTPTPTTTIGSSRSNVGQGSATTLDQSNSVNNLKKQTDKVMEKKKLRKKKKLRQRHLRH